MKKTLLKIIFIAGLSLLLYVIFYCIPNLGRITKSKEMRSRISDLINWNSVTSEYLRVNNQLPKSLYELVSTLDYKTPSLFIDDNGKENVNNIFEMLDSEKLFEKYVDYELIIRSQNAWFIIEKRAGELYRNILVIDQDGNIYKLKKISQVKTSGLAGTKDNLD